LYFKCIFEPGKPWFNLPVKKNKMETDKKTQIIVENTISVPVEKLWQYWVAPEHIKRWNHASADWHTPFAENDLRVGGKFLSRMEARDGSFGFDFGGVYDKVKINELIEYTLGDGRKVKVSFFPVENGTRLVEIFEAENSNPVEMQKTGWQSILDNFKNYAESI
jgi:uncharacterized protein YndB with AHSA1/START domain